jgi:hypothetical protein
LHVDKFTKDVISLLSFELIIGLRSFNTEVLITSCSLSSSEVL